MPEMRGFEATAAIRCLQIILPVISMTAHAMEGDRERCLLAGMDDYLSKPFDRLELERLLGQWAGAPKRAHDAA